MPAPLDSNSDYQQFAHPEKLVSTDWLAQHLDHPDVVVVESDEDVLLYETGHIPGAVKVDWHMDLNDPITRDYLDGEKFAALMASKGIRRDSTVVFYGDNFNWWAAYALWVFTLFGHPDVRLLDGGRQKWSEEGRPMTTHRVGRAPRGRALSGRVQRREAPHAGLSTGGCAAGWPHPRRRECAVEARRKRRRHVSRGR
jgi:thiosulfate/3-mercaptopyruvate sulfurtransferase